MIAAPSGIRPDVRAQASELGEISFFLQPRIYWDVVEESGSRGFEVVCTRPLEQPLELTRSH